MKNNNARPFLKWAGGKSQLLDQIEVYYPHELKHGKVKRYVEPFLGGGAVFFDLQSKYNFEEIILNDINKEVIFTYDAIKEQVFDLIDILSNIQGKYLSYDMGLKEKMFYEQRAAFNEEKVKINLEKVTHDNIIHAARMIFLNKTCFNGLYRQNRKGQYNVPFGKRRNVTICDSDNILQVSKALKNVTLLCGDFEKLSEFIDKNTFIYMDPPYRPLSSTSSFSQYSEFPFDDESQKRLAKWTKYIDKLGAKFLLSNSDPTNTDQNDDFFKKIYSDFSINKVMASRAINSKGNNRGKLRELLITNIT